MSLGNWIEIAPHPYFSFFKTKPFVDSLAPLKKEETLIHIFNCASQHHAPVKHRCKRSTSNGHGKEFRVQLVRVVFACTGGCYKLPAWQILMLQRYPADCSGTEGDLTSSHSESNVQYDKAAGLWRDQSSGSGGRCCKSKRCLQQPGDLLHARISSDGVCLLACLVSTKH